MEEGKDISLFKIKNEPMHGNKVLKDLQEKEIDRVTTDQRNFSLKVSRENI